MIKTIKPGAPAASWATSVAATLAALLLACPAAQAGPIALNTYLQFSFDTLGAEARGCDPADPAGNFCVPSAGTATQFLDAPAWTFNSAQATTLTVVDVFQAGDSFIVYDFGRRIGSTTLFTELSGADCGDDPVQCLANPNMGRGVFELAAGRHSLSLVTQYVVGSSGTAYLHVGTAAVPEPSSLALVLAGLVMTLKRVRRGLGGGHRRAPVAHRATPASRGVA